MEKWLIEYNGNVLDIVEVPEEVANLIAKNYLREICDSDEDEIDDCRDLMRVWLYEDHEEFEDLDFSSYDYRNGVGVYEQNEPWGGDDE